MLKRKENIYFFNLQRILEFEMFYYFLKIYLVLASCYYDFTMCHIMDKYGFI